MTSRPRVSVVIPTFQGESRIGRTLGRLRSQTFSDFEILVVNDGSTDGTTGAVERLVHADGRIRLLEQRNLGIASARNHGIERSCGDLLAFLDDDDLWHPRKLELQVARLDAVPGAMVVSCHSALLDSAGCMLGWRMGGSTEGNVYREMLEWDMISGGSVALVRRGPLEEAGGFDATLREREDWDLWIRMSRRHHFTFVPRTLVGYTRREGSVSQDYDRMIVRGRVVLAKARKADSDISDVEFRGYVAREQFRAACMCLFDDRSARAWPFLRRSLWSGPGIILARPRRWGIILMLVLSTALPRWAHQRIVLAGVSRLAFRIRAGRAFDSHE